MVVISRCTHPRAKYPTAYFLARIWRPRGHNRSRFLQGSSSVVLRDRLIQSNEILKLVKLTQSSFKGMFCGLISLIVRFPRGSTPNLQRGIQGTIAVLALRCKCCNIAVCNIL
jgi:hypothetical protein